MTGDRPEAVAAGNDALGPAWDGGAWVGPAPGRAGGPGHAGDPGGMPIPALGEHPHASRFVVPAAMPVIGPLMSIALRLSDRPLVVAGQRVEAGRPIVERFRETVLLEVATTPDLGARRPGDPVDPARLSVGRRGQAHARPTDRARLLENGPDGRSRLALGRGDQALFSPADGVVEALTPGRLDLRAEGLGLPGRVGWGRPVSGRLIVAVGAPDAELRATAIDVGAAGAIVVAGARLDIEALTRARAIGVAGIICGGVTGRELRQLEESDARQRAGLHASAPFGILALDGYGRRPVPTLAWAVLLAATGRQAGILPEGRMVVIGGDPGPLLPALHRPADAVRIVAGEGMGREARLVGLAGPRRFPGGLYLPGGFIDEVGPLGELRRRVVPLADLERLSVP